MEFEIRHRLTGRILFSIEAGSWKLAIEAAIKQKVSLQFANLSRANLSNADLSAADLSAANLRRANLSNANLSEADLSNADLSEADLSRANLSRVILSNADLSRANLSDANLIDANLSNANLIGIKADLFAVLDVVPNEVAAIRTALIKGNINGSCYEGDCACLVGTVANIRKCNYKEVTGLRPDSNRPAERWLLPISPGDVPENSEIVNITLGWIDEWFKLKK